MSEGVEGSDEGPLLDQAMGTVHLAAATPMSLAYLIQNRTGASVAVSWDDAYPDSSSFEIPPIDLRNPTVGQLLAIVQGFDGRFAFDRDYGLLRFQRNTQSNVFRSTHRYPVDDLVTNRHLWASIPNVRDDPTDGDSREACEEAFRSVVQETIGVGSLGDDSMVLLGNDLIVTQTPEVQAQIADLLEVLRRIADAQEKRRSAPLARVGNP